EAVDFSEQSFASHMNINLRGPMQLSRGLHKILKDEDRGSIVNILDSKVFSLNADFFSYSLSKFGLYGATEMMAQALSPKVRVNGIAPGLTLISETQSAENFELASHLNFVGAPINVEHIAATALYLIETTSINGAVIPVDGGQKMMNFTKDVVNVATGILEKNK
ncbi:MAG: SDR family oxidoreductase, partial [Emcibacteraceae bacterium]|nr:SDR family oxidoreductase [Emcibacteraceae bacterium]